MTRRAHRRTAPPVALASLFGILLLALAPLVVAAGSASATAKLAATTTCPTDYTGATVPCTTSTTTAPATTTTTTPGSSTTTAGSTTTTGTGITTSLIISASLVNSTTVLIPWQACVHPPQGAGFIATLYVDGAPLGGAAGSGAIQNNGSGCTTDPRYFGCLPPGPHVAQAVFNNPAYPATEKESFTIPSGVLCAAATGTATATNGGHSGSLAFTGANIFRALLFAAVLILLGLVITYVARERRRHGGTR